MNSGDLKKSGHIAGKNCIFDALFGIIECIAQTVKFQKRTRIVIEYDPRVENWSMDVFTDEDEPIQNEELKRQLEREEEEVYRALKTLVRDQQHNPGAVFAHLPPEAYGSRNSKELMMWMGQSDRERVENFGKEQKMQETVHKAMLRLDSIMESCVQDYQRERDRINGANNKEKLIELNKEFLPIIERIGVSIADMYRLVEKKDPA